MAIKHILKDNLRTCVEWCISHDTEFPAFPAFPAFPDRPSPHVINGNDIRTQKNMWQFLPQKLVLTSTIYMLIEGELEKLFYLL